MPDYPDEIITAAVDAVVAKRDLVSENSRQWALSIVTTALEAVAVPLGEHVAAKITKHMNAHGPKPGSRLGGKQADDDARRTWRRHFGTAARIAARAFLTKDDLLRLTAQAIERGDYVRCPSLEGDDGR